MAGHLSGIIDGQLEQVNKKADLMYERDKYFYGGVLDKTKSHEIAGRGFYIPYDFAPGGDFGYANLAGESLGRGSMGQIRRGKVGCTDTRLNIEWDFETEFTGKNKKNIVDVINRTLASAMEEYSVHIEGQAMGDGDGVVATVHASTATAGGVVTFENGHFGAKLLRRMQSLDVYDANGGFTTNDKITAGNLAANLKQKVVVRSISKDFKTAHLVTVDESKFPDISAGTATSSASGVEAVERPLSFDIGTDVTAAEIPVGARLVARDTYKRAGMKAIRGVGYMHNKSSTGDFQGLSRVTYPEIQCNNIDAEETTSLTFARLVVNYIGNRLGMNNMNSLEVWCHPCQLHALEILGQSYMTIDKKAAEQNMNLYFNNDGFSLAGAKTRKSFRWNKSVMDYINRSKWGRVTLRKPQFLQSRSGGQSFDTYGDDGGVRTSVLAYLLGSFNFYHENPGTEARIENLAIPTGY